MNKTHGFKILAIKSLAIIGFLVTIAMCVWLLVEGVKRAPAVFSSLATIIESTRLHTPLTEIELATEKGVVNSGESFQVSWTDTKEAGDYHFTYVCTPGIALSVRGGDGVFVPVRCTETLTLPADVHGLFLSITSDTMRLTDVPLVISFTSAEREATLKSETRVTVANANIPVATQTPATTTPVVVVVKEEPKPVVKPAPKPAPKPSVLYPVSDPNGFVDMSVTTLGSGILRNGVFTFTAKYDRDLKNAIRFDIKNVGTKASGPWTFKTILPGGQTYESPAQMSLNPLEHIEYTLSFDLNDDKDLVKITNTAYAKNDKNSKNDSATWHVVVTD